MFEHKNLINYRVILHQCEYQEDNTGVTMQVQNHSGPHIYIANCIYTQG